MKMYYDEMGELIQEDEIFARLVLDNGEEVEYLVSNYGRVWSEKSHKFLAYRYFDSGRKLVEICVHGNRIVLAVARAMALAFYGPVENMHADHIDNDPTNDRLDNIQWLTPQQNVRKMCEERKRRYENYGNKSCEESKHHIYDNDTIHYVCSLMEQGYDSKYISNKTGVKNHTLKKIKNRVSWTDISNGYKVENMSMPKREKIPKVISLFINDQLSKNIPIEDIQKMCIESYNYKVSREILLNRRSKIKRGK